MTCSHTNGTERGVLGPLAMPHVPIHQIELRHLRYVVAVAEDLHFARAANRLHLAAPSLSKQIKQLENILGYPLFERRTRHVVLTKSGLAFVSEAREALARVALAVNLSAAVSGTRSVVAMGYSPWIDLPWIINGRDQLRQEIGIDISLQSEHTTPQVVNLLAGRLSAGIVILPIKATGLMVHALRRERLLLALPKSHSLAESAAITFRELSGEPFISVPSSLEPALHDYLRLVGEESGFVPNVVHEVASLSEALELVASNMGTALVRASAAHRLQVHGVVFCECSEPELFVEIGLACRTQHPSPAAENLITLLRRVVSENS